MTKIYAGIGARETPERMQRTMWDIAVQLSSGLWVLRSGHARGADQAFEKGASFKEIHLPWNGYNHATIANSIYIVPKPSEAVQEIAQRFHPAWDKLTSEAKLFMCRNVTIVLGEQLNNHVDMVICWTPNARLVGGTSHAMKVAYAYDIPVFNLADAGDQRRLCEFTEQYDANTESTSLQETV